MTDLERLGKHVGEQRRMELREVIRRWAMGGSADVAIRAIRQLHAEVKNGK